MRALVVGPCGTERLPEILSKASFDVVQAGSVRDAVKVLSEIGPTELALLDWDLPGAGALRLVRTLRSSRVYDGMRLLMVTGALDMTRIFEAVRAGVDDYLSRPVTRKKLLEKLSALRFYMA